MTADLAAALAASEARAEAAELYARQAAAAAQSNYEKVKAAESQAAELRARCEALAGALQPFADLAELFDDEMRGGNMPSRDEHSVAEWPRINKDYVLSVGHLRAARALLAEPSAQGSKT